jgi:putative ATP-dependent endonuclease of OLD family
LLSIESAEKKINLFLVEEPETHLHKSMQIALSRILFSDEKYGYLFVSTHSPFVLYEMDSVNLVRVFNATKITGASTFYKVPEGFETMRKMLNRKLAEAIFADRVLLVESESECLLFEKVLSVVSPFFEADGIYILGVCGVGFDKYYNILQRLHISALIKTDNDLRSVSTGGYSVLGFSRVNGLIGKKLLPTERIAVGDVAAKRALYDANKFTLDSIRFDSDVYLSRCDLENDLFEVLGETLSSYFKACNDAVAYLQEAKQCHMVELIESISDDDCRKIYNHYNFACLKAVNG